MASRTRGAAGGDKRAGRAVRTATERGKGQGVATGSGGRGHAAEIGTATRRGRGQGRERRSPNTRRGVRGPAPDPESVLTRAGKIGLPLEHVQAY